MRCESNRLCRMQRRLQKAARSAPIEPHPNFRTCMPRAAQIKKGRAQRINGGLGACPQLLVRIVPHPMSRHPDVNQCTTSNLLHPGPFHSDTCSYERHSFAFSFFRGADRDTPTPVLTPVCRCSSWTGMPARAARGSDAAVRPAASSDALSSSLDNLHIEETGTADVEMAETEPRTRQRITTDARSTPATTGARAHIPSPGRRQREGSARPAPPEPDLTRPAPVNHTRIPTLTVDEPGLEHTTHTQPQIVELMRDVVDVSQRTFTQFMRYHSLMHELHAQPLPSSAHEAEVEVRRERWFSEGASDLAQYLASLASRASSLAEQLENRRTTDRHSFERAPLYSSVRRGGGRMRRYDAPNMTHLADAATTAARRVSELDESVQRRRRRRSDVTHPADGVSSTLVGEATTLAAACRGARDLARIRVRDMEQLYEDADPDVMDVQQVAIEDAEACRILRVHEILARHAAGLEARVQDLRRRLLDTGLPTNRRGVEDRRRTLVLLAEASQCNNEVLGGRYGMRRRQEERRWDYPADYRQLLPEGAPGAPGRL
jgi:hypothetical protein